MDLMKTAKEIGLFETALNLSEVSGSAGVMNGAGAVMPLPPEDMSCVTDEIARWLLSFGKRKYLFLFPENAVAERMAEQKGKEIEIIYVLSRDMEEDARDRLTDNLPKKTDVILLEEPFFPSEFTPENGMIVVSGYLAAGRMMVTEDTFRMTEHYNSRFYGKKAFIPYTQLRSAVRYGSWKEAGMTRFKEIWRREA